MAISIRQIHPVFVGEVSGVDLRQPLSRDEVAAIEAGMETHRVLPVVNAVEAAESLRSLVREGDMVLVKGSRALRLEKILE